MTVIDERFLRHRLRSTSTAGIVGGVFAAALWYYRYIVDHQLNWDLFAIAVTIVAVKIGMMIYYRITD